MTLYSRGVAPSKSTSIVRGPLEAALRNALAHLENLDAAGVAPVAPLDELRGRMAHPLTDEGTPAEQVIADLAADTAGGIMGNARAGASTRG